LIRAITFDDIEYSIHFLFSPKHDVCSQNKNTRNIRDQRSEISFLMVGARTKDQISLSLLVAPSTRNSPFSSSFISRIMWVGGCNVRPKNKKAEYYDKQTCAIKSGERNTVYSWFFGCIYFWISFMNPALYYDISHIFFLFA